MTKIPDDQERLDAEYLLNMDEDCSCDECKRWYDLIPHSELEEGYEYYTAEGEENFFIYPPRIRRIVTQNS